MLEGYILSNLLGCETKKKMTRGVLVVLLVGLVGLWFLGVWVLLFFVWGGGVLLVGGLGVVWFLGLVGWGVFKGGRCK